MLQSLFQKKLLLVTGKGGVGKSTLSLSLAQVAASQGKRVLIIALAGEEIVTYVYGLKELAPEPIQLEGTLFAQRLDPHTALHEYALRQIKFEFLYKHVFENRVVKYFLDATPGLKDLLLLGKIIDLAESKRSDWDLVIVDMPATGHGMHILRIPQVVKSMVLVGPLHKHASRMDDFLHDQTRTGVCLVTLAEEMPVNESLEMLEALSRDLRLKVEAILVNSVYPKLFSMNEIETWSAKAEQPMARTMIAAARAEEKRRALQSEYIEKLRSQSKGVPVGVLPFLFERTFGLSAIKNLGQTLLAEVG